LDGSRPFLDILSSSDKVPSVDFDVCGWITAAFYIGIVLRENAFWARLYLIATGTEMLALNSCSEERGGPYPCTRLPSIPLRTVPFSIGANIFLGTSQKQRYCAFIAYGIPCHGRRSARRERGHRRWHTRWMGVPGGKVIRIEPEIIYVFQGQEEWLWRHASPVAGLRKLQRRPRSVW
jgi:hypothetical protein